MRKYILISLFFFTIAATTAMAQGITRPLKDKGPTEVAIQLFVVDIDNVDTARQNFDANVYYKLTWHDPRLANLDTEKIRKPLNEVWHPRLQFINQQRIWSTFPEIVDVYPSGKVIYRQRVWGSFSQPLELKDFPFDVQSFKLILTPAGYNKDEVKFVTSQEDKSGLALRFSVADWKMPSWMVGTKAAALNPDIELYIMSIKGIRNHGYFIIQMIIPLIIIVMMSWTVFWIDPMQAGTQIGVSTISILTLTSYRFVIGLDLPKFSYLTRLDYFTLTATLLVFASLLEVIVTSWLARNGKVDQARKIDLWARWVFPTIFLAFAGETLFFHFLI